MMEEARCITKITSDMSRECSAGFVGYMMFGRSLPDCAHLARVNGLSEWGRQIREPWKIYKAVESDS